jgi:hypothetical protein
MFFGCLSNPICLSLWSSINESHNAKEEVMLVVMKKQTNCESYFIYAAITSPPNLRLLGGTDSAFGNYM